MNRSSEYELKYVIDVEMAKKTPRMSDKKLAMIMLVIITLVGIIAFWFFLQFVFFMIRMSNALPHFIDEGEKIVTERVMR